MKVATLATVTVKDGHGPTFEAMFRKAQALVQAGEPGALVYELTHSRADPNVYKAMEIYRDADAHKAHGQAEGFSAIFAELGAILAGPPELETLDVVD